MIDHGLCTRSPRPAAAPVRRDPIVAAVFAGGALVSIALRALENYYGVDPNTVRSLVARITWREVQP